MAAAAPAISTATTVFKKGPHDVAPLNPVKVDVGPDQSIELMVLTPTDAGIYPVVLFLNGWHMVNSWYECLLTHVASHGFIAVMPQLYYGVTLENKEQVKATGQVAAWLTNGGLSNVLDSAVQPDLSRLALAGHSLGGDTAFALALGLGGTPTPMFSALIGVDPVAGLSKDLQVEPKVLTFKPMSLNVGMPVLVLGTGLGPKHVGGPPCAPAGVNHVQFYDECVPPKYHFVVRDYGHLDMLDDGVSYLIKCMCMRNLKDQHLARRAMGGLMVAFLRAALQHHDEDLKVVLANPPGLAPAVLDKVQHDD